MDMDSFREAYPSLDTALGGEFHDSDTGDDLAIARNVRFDLPAGSRARFLSDLLDDAQRALANVSKLWELIAADANRCLYSESETREWLSRMVVVWKDELTKIKNAKPAP